MKTRELGSFLILAFIITLFRASEAEASITPFIEVGQTMHMSEAPIGGVGFSWNDKWEVSRKYIGGGTTNKYGAPEPSGKVWTIDRAFKLGDHLFISIGLAHIDQSLLVDSYNFNLQVGWNLNTGKGYGMHISSLDINENNTGINAAIWRQSLGDICDAPLLFAVCNVGQG